MTSYIIECGTAGGVEMQDPDVGEIVRWDYTDGCREMVGMRVSHARK